MEDKVCIIGVGYVGEHLVEVFSRNYPIVGYDISKSRISILKEKYTVIHNNVYFTSNPSDPAIDECNIFLICVPTLVREDKLINNTYLEQACDFVKQKISDDKTIVLESTISIGTTRNLLGDLRKQNVYVGFSPERVDPGRTDINPYDIPKIVSGIDEESLNKIKDIYSKVYKNVVPVTSCETAELCKLYENCFRMVNIAYINEISDTCKRHNIDVNEMIKACSTKPFGFMPFYPSLGVGGSCIPVNPYYLFYNCELPLLDYATALCDMRPGRKAKEFIEQYWSNNKRILFVGAGFKPGQGLTLFSPAVKFLDSLSEILKLSEIHVYDPLVDILHSKYSYKLLGADVWNSEYIDANYDILCILMLHPTINMKITEDLKTCKMVDYRY